MKNIVFLVESTFNWRDYERFGVSFFKNNGFNVEVWDFTPFLQPEYYQKHVPPDICSSESWLCLFSKKSDAISAINQLDKNTVCISFISHSIDSRRIYQSLSNRKIRYIMLLTGILPVSLKPARFLKIPSNWKNLINSIYGRLSCRMSGFDLPYFVVLTGEKSRNYLLRSKMRGSPVLEAHTYDYEQYLLQIAEEKKIGQRNITVFLDEYMPFHPDYVHQKLNSPVTEEVYYSELREFFTLIENEHNIEVVIAAHPRSNYEDKGLLFGERRVIRGETASLVRQSQFVLCHASTSISYAVLFSKPLIFITTNQLQSSFMRLGIKKLADELSCDVVNISLSGNIIVQTVNEVVLKSYRDNYLKCKKSRNVSLWQNVMDSIE